MRTIQANRRLQAKAVVAILLAAAAASCDAGLLDDIAWDNIPSYTLTISAGEGGSAVPSGAVSAKKGVAMSLTATHDTGYHFVEWTVESGAGVSFGDASRAITTVTLADGNAAIKANFGINNYTLTVTKTGTGTTAPSGSVGVTHGVAYPISASPGSGQVFKGWSVTSETAAAIESPLSASTSVILSEGDATVSAAFEEWHGWQDLAAAGASCSDTIVDGTDVHAVWVEGGALKYRLSEDGGMTWGDALTLDGSGNVGASCSLGLVRDDITNMVVVAYYDSAAGDLKTARFYEGDAMPTLTTIDSTGDVGSSCQLAAAPPYDDLVLKAGGVCIAYYDATNGDLKIAKSLLGSSWYVETVDSGGDVGSFCSITHGTSKDGEWFISYVDATNQDIKWARASAVDLAGATAWTIDTLASDAAINEHTAIAMDPATGNGILAYRTDTAATFPAGSLLVFATDDRFETLSALPIPETTAGAGVAARLRFRQYGVASYCLAYIVDREALDYDYARCLVSTDGGATWTVRAIPGQESGSTRAVSSYMQGEVLWYTFSTSGGSFPSIYSLTRQAKSIDGGATW